jgi:Lon protease-like protein
MISTFHPTIEALPESIAVFPLPQAIVMPWRALPLNIFEPRYLAMTQDALATPQRLIGMIQPDPQAADPGTEPELLRVGCAGRITGFQELADGRYFINLTGVCRFDLREEIATIRGYRRFVVSWDRFANDLAPHDGDIDAVDLKARLRGYAEQRALRLDWSEIEKLEGEILVDALAQSLPFGVEEKQVLLECPGMQERLDYLSVLLGTDSGTGDSEPVLH